MFKVDLKLFDISNQTILMLPKSISQKLPSRGQVMIEGSVNGFRIKEPLEPDGKGSHFLKLSDKILDNIKVKIGVRVELEFSPTTDWPDPNVPPDLKAALVSDKNARATWNEITPKAKWDWIRWVRGTKNDKTHKRRIEVAISKLKSGMRRPCCFNRTECTDPIVSNKGILREPTVLE